MSAKLPPSLKLKQVIKRLQEYDKMFNLFAHEQIQRKWVLQRKNEEGDIVDAYPLVCPKGLDTEIDHRLLNRIIKRFQIPRKVLTD